jgi:hypothetical protein
MQTAPPDPNILDEFISEISTTRAPPSPFEDLIAAVAEGPAERAKRTGPPPPPSRFRVRVAQVGRPHRATKRNYDYFEELNAAIAVEAEGRRITESN